MMEAEVLSLRPLRGAGPGVPAWGRLKTGVRLVAGGPKGFEGWPGPPDRPAPSPELLVPGLASIAPAWPWVKASPASCWLGPKFSEMLTKLRIYNVFPYAVMWFCQSPGELLEERAGRGHEDTSHRLSSSAASSSEGRGGAPSACSRPLPAPRKNKPTPPLAPTLGPGPPRLAPALPAAAPRSPA